jgi:glycosyltransferase involved in cell wall biosynthesis
VYTCYDLGFLVEPAWTTEANRVGCFQGMFRSAIHADWVVAISESTRAHYLRTFPHFPADRTRVIPPCSRFDPAALKPRPPARAASLEPGRFWLSVGTIEPRKNQRRLAQAYARYLALGGEPMPLVLAGGSGWLMEDFASTLRDLGIEPRVVRTGYVDDGELAWLYRNCFANLYPSLFEGFGLPVLEGMQFGAPTIASNASSIPEVAGDAAILLHPEDVEAWAQAMLRLANDAGARAAFGLRAAARASAFDWRESARRLLDLYDEAVHTPRREALAA